ncbi:MAG: molybdate ABC transporter substrate-binding protein [Syntrophobacteraceae bacterium]|nr:molybdate ABC transporter substrate-binding protein [Syntrophobacteraceae bacterium]
MNRKPFVGLLLALVFLGVSPLREAVAEQELIVSAAASLTNVFQEIAREFMKANPGIKVVPNFAASGVLLQQIERGAPVDVFASADQKTMDQAAEKKLILPETRKNFAGNSLVLIVPLHSKVQVNNVQDLTAKEVARVSLGNPASVPAGRYAQQVLTNEGLWEKLGPKLVLGESVRQVLDYVSRGEVEAGFDFGTDALIAKDKVRVVATMTKHEPILYPIAVVATTVKKDSSRQFIDFVQGPEGREILSKYGFRNP